MSNEIDRSRELGIELGDLPSKLDEVSFPVGKDELLASHGDHELTLPDEETRHLESVLEPAGVDRFRSVDGLLHTVYHMVGNDAVGQVGRTGRGTSDITPPPEQRPPGKPDGETEIDQSL